MPKITEIIPRFVELMPDELEEGVLYISEKYSTAIHLCACGCGGKTVTPIDKSGWTLIKSVVGPYGAELFTLRPSIGNWKWEDPYHAHYYITDNKIEWLQ